ncbi:ABC transporter ATP-binding protein [Nonomuraea gerenzanensis]|uniref:Branched-chain amino acid transport ATP-binding protein LivF (TC 3.A.1.4.1) n=1 Tax=Nonomuraea gerenzanensis TaxID=93944 RepID=A0A1M4EAE3_9ACTN|nr:ATP-binding cassette domain-containing protein [Nonomuraea gerenzanensis]UBU17928.1 ATP-binding cassette domain-containing protein [Nonomuraea gerenzanensis]SBO95724.1 Branched-chain amino acid transport ATP-binding protein LivF (TC 3.A.1.4.1) [Nonomuraea gerenzanensis]
MTDLLAVRDLRAGYAGTTVLDGVDLVVAAGAVVALLGRNGAGKSTFVHTVMGLLKPYAGSVRVGGRELAGAPAHAVARSGVAIVPQGRRVFAPLTVAENLSLAAGRTARSWTVERVYELMPGLAERRAHRGDQLSGGEQQMLAIGRALLRDPRLLLLDEPSDGLAPAVVEQVAAVLEGLRGEGIAAVLVEQDLHLAFRLADEVAVMQKGRIVHRSPVAEFRADRARAHALLGVG